ncbi:MAG: hypothetical protein IPG90_09810 [Bacteroidetes bacterium]|nr:hypothetical protein [Bacteroidota bacterium]
MADDYFKQFPNKAWSPYEVYYIYSDSKGTMWFGTSNFGVCDTMEYRIAGCMKTI